MYTIDYLIEKFLQAVYDLATGTGNLKARIAEAHSRIMHLQPDDFPKELVKKRENITEMLTRLEGRDGYIIPDNLKKMRNKTATKIAEMICDLYFDLLAFKDKNDEQK